MTFARRFTSIENFLTKHWDWGDSGTAGSRALNDPVEQTYEMCYPGITVRAPIHRASS